MAAHEELRPCSALGQSLGSTRSTFVAFKSKGLGSTRRAGESSQAKASLQERFNCLEQNMLRNFELMREHKQHTEAIRQSRREKEEAEKAREPEAILTSGTCTPRSTPRPLVELGQGHMWQRCAVLEEHTSANGRLLQSHRAVLDDVHAVKRAQAQQLLESQRAAARLSAASPSCNTASMWQADPDVEARRSVSARSSAGAVAALEALSQGCNAEVADAAGASGRPISAAASAKMPPLGWLSLGPPPSRGPLSARCRELDRAVKNNKKMLLANREGIDAVVKLRKERTEMMTTDFKREMKDAFDFKNM